MQGDDQIMAEYLIGCVTKTARTGGHQHIASVGIGGQKYTVARIYDLMDQGHTFRTASTSTGREAPVAKYHYGCCDLDTLRSYSDGIWDNNLDNLPACR
jgi:hypothetical protein